MRLLIDLYDAAGNRLGSGPVRTALGASITATLDGPASVSWDFPASDTATRALLQNKRRARIFLDRQDGQPLAEVGRMIVEKIGTRVASSGWTTSVEGPDTLAELKFVNARRGRVYTTQQVATVADALLALTTGWSRGGTAAQLVSARLDGASVLKALQAITGNVGLHFRQNPLGVVEVGAFGASSGLVIANRETAPREWYDSDVALIDRLTLEEDSEDLINWLEPIGAGRGDSAITLEKAVATRSVALGYAYDIRTETGPDGRTIYYLQDDASVNAYGRVEKVGEFRQVSLVGTTESDQVATAEALYDLAAAHLQRYSAPYRAYSVQAVHVRKPLLPGDKVRVRGMFQVANEDGALVDVLSVDEDFWVMETTRHLDEQERWDLKIANIDRYMQDAAEIVVGAIESITVQNVVAEPNLSHHAHKELFDIDASNPARFRINITTRTVRLVEFKIRVVTTPLRSNAKSAAGVTSAGGGDHNHIIMQLVSNTPGGYSTRKLSMAYGSTSSPSIGFFDIPSSVAYSGSLPADYIVTASASGDHTHTIPAGSLVYGLYVDNEYPAGVKIEVDGVVIAENLAPDGNAIDTTLDITEALSQGSLQGVHNMVVSCTGGQGSVEIFFDVTEIIAQVETTE